MAHVPTVSKLDLKKSNFGQNSRINLNWENKDKNGYFFKFQCVLFCFFAVWAICPNLIQMLHLREFAIYRSFLRYTVGIAHNIAITVIVILCRSIWFWHSLWILFSKTFSSAVGLSCESTELIRMYRFEVMTSIRFFFSFYKLLITNYYQKWSHMI